MLDMGALIEIGTQSGRPIQADDFGIVPLVRRTRLQIPNYRGAFVWQRPKALVIQAPNGRQEILPIRDHTRWAQMLLIGIGLFGSILIWLFLRPNQN